MPGGDGNANLDFGRTAIFRGGGGNANPVISRGAVLDGALFEEIIQACYEFFVGKHEG